MAQQTAVEWLESNINEGIFCDHICGEIYWDKETLLGFIEQAKQMEKEQKEQLFNNIIENIGTYLANDTKPTLDEILPK